MLEILLCCGAGMSSSALTAQCNKSIIANGLGDVAHVEFSPFDNSPRALQEKKRDVIICCPHLAREAKEFIERKGIDIPVYILPPQMYGVINGPEIVQDCKDVIERFYNDPERKNPVQFPGETNVFQIKRKRAYYNEYPDRRGK